MARVMMVSAILFWTGLLGLAALRVGTCACLYPEEYGLFGIPLGMIAFTVLVWRVARNPRLTPGAIAGGSIVAVFASLMWIGILGAGV